HRSRREPVFFKGVSLAVAGHIVARPCTRTPKVLCQVKRTPTASEQLIRAASHRRAKEVHPDVSPDRTSEFVALKGAYDMQLASTLGHSTAPAAGSLSEPPFERAE